MHPTPTPRTAAACPGGAASSCPWSPPTPHGAAAAAPWSPPLQPFAPPPPSGPLAGCTAADLCAPSPAVWAPPPAASAPPLACLPMLPASAALRRRLQRHGRRRSVLHRRLHLSSILAPRRAPWLAAGLRTGEPLGGGVWRCTTATQPSGGWMPSLVVRGSSSMASTLVAWHPVPLVIGEAAFATRSALKFCRVMAMASGEEASAQVAEAGTRATSSFFRSLASWPCSSQRVQVPKL